MQQPAGSSDDPLVAFGVLEDRCSALLGAPRTLVVTGMRNSDMDGTYELEDSVNRKPHWVNRDGCHCDNCPGSACHIYWAISTPSAHCNHNCPRWTIDMDLEPNSRTSSYPGSAALPPLGSATWYEYSVRGPGRPGTYSTQVHVSECLSTCSAPHLVHIVTCLSFDLTGVALHLTTAQLRVAECRC